jgi:hypothetical protein
MGENRRKLPGQIKFPKRTTGKELEREINGIWVPLGREGKGFDLPETRGLGNHNPKSSSPGAGREWKRGDVTESASSRTTQ